MSIQKRGCEQREQHSRAQRVNVSRTHNQLWNPNKGLSPLGHFKVHKDLVNHQFSKVYKPHWFGTIQWQPFIFEFSEAVKETRHFRNKLLCSLLNVKLRKLPDPPLRPRIIWFHERALVQINPRNPGNSKFKNVFHTHFHLGKCPEPYDSLIPLDWLIRQKVLKDFDRVSKNKSLENQGFVLKEWVHKHHANYNLKDYFRYQHSDDPDLLLDYENSDLEFGNY